MSNINFKKTLDEVASEIPQTEYGKQESVTNGKVTLQYFPEGFQALNKELSTGLHPKLETLLANHPANEMEVRLAEIATYCSIAMDGAYGQPELDKLCFILAGRLEVLREAPEAPSIILQ